MNIEKFLSESLRESVECQEQFWRDEKQSFFAAAELLGQVVRSKNKVMIFGNGGSACDALHFAGEWINRFSVDRAPIACLALTADAPLITCIANDYSFDHIFERQILGLGQSGDVGIGISTSGNSKNVILGLEACRARGMKTIALLGGTGGEIAAKSLADLKICVRATPKTPRIQETHSWILHSLCDYIEIEVLKIR